MCSSDLSILRSAYGVTRRVGSEVKFLDSSDGSPVVECSLVFLVKVIFDQFFFLQSSTDTVVKEDRILFAGSTDSHDKETIGESRSSYRWCRRTVRFAVYELTTTIVLEWSLFYYGSGEHFSKRCVAQRVSCGCICVYKDRL